jgi:phosphoglycerate dehydrogenase-like enzyme
MTFEPEREEPQVDSPLTRPDAVTHVAHLTGMTQESARAFVAFHSGLRHAAPRQGRTPS